MTDKPSPCRHCCIIDALNAHAAAFGPAEHGEVLEALAQVTLQILREIVGEKQYPDEAVPHDAVKH